MASIIMGESAPMEYHVHAENMILSVSVWYFVSNSGPSFKEYDV